MGAYVGMRVGIVRLETQIIAVAANLLKHDEYAFAIANINSKLLPLEVQMKLTEKMIQELRDWKHDLVDAYIPRAVDEHERRINRLDAKVFNGLK